MVFASSITQDVGAPTLGPCQRLLAISDLHLSSESAERNALFVHFLETAHAAQDAVLIVGDLFELWFGWPHLSFPYQRPILERMEQLSGQGLTLYYVEGNRDFGVAENAGRIFARAAVDRLRIDCCRGAVLAEHGDRINRADRLYRAWRGISKNRLSFSILSRMSADTLLPLAGKLERRMRTTNRQHKTGNLPAITPQFLRVRNSEDCEIVVLGHFHTEGRQELTDGKRTVFIYNLPGWEQGFRYLVIPREGRPHYKDMGR